MYFNGAFNLDDWSDSVEYAVFDDFPDWSKFLSYKQFLGGQHQFTVTDKYRKKMTVKWSKPCIILSNDLPNFPDMEWVKANCLILKVSGKLF